MSSTNLFMFLDEFKKSFEKDHSNAKHVFVISKAKGEKWKNLFEFEKTTYIAKGSRAQ